MRDDELDLRPNAALYGCVAIQQVELEWRERKDSDVLWDHAGIGQKLLKGELYARLDACLHAKEARSEEHERVRDRYLRELSATLEHTTRRTMEQFVPVEFFCG